MSLQRSEQKGKKLFSVEEGSGNSCLQIGQVMRFRNRIEYNRANELARAEPGYSLLFLDDFAGLSSGLDSAFGLLSVAGFASPEGFASFDSEPDPDSAFAAFL